MPPRVFIRTADIRAGKDRPHTRLPNPVRNPHHEIRRQRARARQLLEALAKEVLAPDSIRFPLTYPPNQAPQPASYAPAISFSLSHDANAVGVAVGINCTIGIDVLDYPRRHLRKKIAARFFHPNEQQLFQECSDRKSERLFDAFWTLKESSVKCCGGNLLHHLYRDFSGSPWAMELRNALAHPEYIGAGFGFHRPIGAFSSLSGYPLGENSIGASVLRAHYTLGAVIQSNNNRLPEMYFSEVSGSDG